ncbi:hypothetical protein RhiirB3_391492 [Rhizophagus irregularis]|nr:hypothetical protein RhiirB3_391492 [Rhizophagus irregularis]
MVCRVTQTKRFPRRRENIDRLEKRKAALLGTSVKRSDLRAAMARDLTTYQDYEQRNKITRETGGIRFTIQNFKLDYFSILTPMKLIIAAKNRKTNPRFVPGTKNVLLKNARILDGIGGDFIGDLLLKDGIILSLKEIKRRINHHALDAYRIPDVIKRASSQITIATFSDLWGYKKEAFQASTRISRRWYTCSIKSMSFNIISMSFLCHLTTLKRTASSVIIKNIGKVFIDVDTIIESNSLLNGKNINISIIVKDGRVEFIGTNCTNTIDIVTRNSPEVIGLNGGYILPGMIAVGT